MEISCKFIFFTLEIVALVQWNLKMPTPIWCFGSMTRPPHAASSVVGYASDTATAVEPNSNRSRETGRPYVQSICLLFVSWQSDHFGQRYSQFHIWPWNFKAKVMAKFEPDCHIWGLVINWQVCFSFPGSRTIFGWDITNSIFDLENIRSRSWPRSDPMVTLEA